MTKSCPPQRKTFDSPLANHFSAVTQGVHTITCAVKHHFFQLASISTQYVVVQKNMDTFCCIFSLQIRFYLLSKPEMFKQLKARRR
jgi:hypothetical protein